MIDGGLTKILADYGPWAVTAVSFLAIGVMYRDLKRVYRGTSEILASAIAVIQSNTDALKEVRKAIEKCNRTTEE